MKKIKAIILRNELEDDHNPWVKACEEYRNDIEYRIADLTTSDWIEEIQKECFDILLAKPSRLTAPFKQLYDERIYILAYVQRNKIYPSPLEIFIYENKRFLSYWLKANNIPHPETWVSYNRKEALDFIEINKYPVVTKSNIGASGSGVTILHNRSEAVNYVNDTFSGKGAQRRSGPNLSKGGLMLRGFHYLLHPADIPKKLNIYKTIRSDLQSDFIIFQEYIDHDYEWRVVRIGDSFFAHKKLKKGEKASGTLLKVYDSPPFNLLDFVKQITDRHEFNSQAIDIFESEFGYLINEMQCIFGQSDPYQMLVGDKAGRYRYIDDHWIFESGLFNANESYNLRIQYVIETFNDKI